MYKELKNPLELWNIPHKSWEKIKEWNESYKYYSEEQLLHIFNKSNDSYLRIDPFSGYGLIINPAKNIYNEIPDFQIIYKYNNSYYIYYELDPDYWKPSKNKCFPNYGTSLMCLVITETTRKTIRGYFRSLDDDFWEDFDIIDYSIEEVLNILKSIIDLLPIMDYFDILEFLDPKDLHLSFDKCNNETYYYNILKNNKPIYKLVTYSKVDINQPLKISKLRVYSVLSI